MKRLRDLSPQAALIITATLALQLLAWCFGAQPSLALGKKHPSDPVVQIPPSNRNYLKVLTLNFNSEDVRADSAGMLREQRFAALIDWIAKNDADIVLLQEAWSFRGHPSVALDLARVLVGYDVHYRLVMGAPGFFYDSDVILAKKQYLMSDRHDYKLQHSAWDIGDGKNWTLVFGRVTYALGVRLTLGNGDPLYVYTSHFIGADEGERSDQARDLIGKIQERLTSRGTSRDRAKVLLAGDLNLHPDSPGSQALRGVGFEDTFDRAHPGDSSCTDCADPESPYFNPITIGAGLFPDQSDETSSWRSDYLYARGMPTLASTLQFSVPFESIWMSDHYGILSVLATGGGVPEIPNPTHDSESASTPTVLRVDRDLLPCATERCDPWLPEIRVRSSRGLVVQNRLRGALHMALHGPGNIYTKHEAQLERDRAAAFTFDTNGKFSLDIETSQGEARFGVVNVEME